MYAGWRLAFHPAVAKEQGDLVADAVTHLELAVKANDKFAEAKGLLGVVYGAQIGKNPELGATLGPAAGGSIMGAISLEPDNPRLIFLHGAALFYTPAELEAPKKRKRSSGMRCSCSRRNRPTSRGRTGAASTRTRGSVRRSRGTATTRRLRAEYAAALEDCAEFRMGPHHVAAASQQGLDLEFRYCLRSAGLQACPRAQRPQVLRYDGRALSTQVSHGLERVTGSATLPAHLGTILPVSRPSSLTA